MKNIFRTSWKYWIKNEGGLLLFTITALIVSVWFNQKLLAGFCVVTLPGTLLSVYKLLLSKVEIDKGSIFWSEKTKQIKIHWSEVLSVQLLEKYSMPSKALLIGTASEFSVVEIDHFDHRLIWQLVQEFAPKSSLEQDANRKTPAYQKWEAQAQKFRDELTAPFLVSDHWVMNVLGWGAVLFSILSLTPIFKGEPGFWLWLGASIFFFGVGVFMILWTGTFQIGKEEIVRSSKLGNYRIQWDEVTYIEYDLYGSIVLNGCDKYLTIYSPEWWASKDRIAADFLFSEIRLRNIEMKQIRVSFKMSKNTKFRKSSTENNE